jgi:cytochrome P450
MFPALQVDLGPWSPWGRIERIKQRVDREVYAEIQRRRVAREQDDLLGCLLSATGEDGHRLSDSEVRDEVLTLVVAGHEITASVLSWLFYAIVSRPDVLANVRRELADKSSRVEDLTYLDAVMRESMRYYSTIPNGSARIVKTPTRIRGHELPAGTLVTVALHLLHRRPEIFDEPEHFMPERFIDSKFAPYEYAPFGGGDRRCLGMAIAIHEIKTIVATVLERVELVSVTSHVRPVRRGAFLAPEAGLPVRVTPVRSPAATSELIARTSA